MSANNEIKPKKKHTVQYDRWGYFFLAPFFLIYIVFSLIPLLMTFVNTFVEQYNVGLEVEGPNFKVPTYFKGQEKFYTNDIKAAQDALNAIAASGNVDEAFASNVKSTILDTANMMDTSNKAFSKAYDKMAKSYAGKSSRELTEATKALMSESRWSMKKDTLNRVSATLDDLATKTSTVDAEFTSKVKSSLSAVAIPVRFNKAFDSLAAKYNGKPAKDFVEASKNLVGKTEWALVKNFREVFASDLLKYGWNTVIMWVLGFVPQIVVSLVLSVWFTNTELKLKFQQFFKTVIYMPNLIMASAFAMLFFTLFSDAGPINSIFIKLGWMSADDPLRYLQHTGWTRTLVAAMNFLMWYGNTTILLMAGIMGIDESLFEAARIDGASPIQVFFKVTMPLLMPIFVYVFITSMIGGIQMFDVPQILTNGTGQPDRTSFTMIMYLNNNMTSKNYGRSGAISIILFAVTGILSSFVYRSNMKQYQGKGR